MHIDANGVRTYCEVAGPEDALPVVFVHGLAASADVWREPSRRLARRFRTICYDLRSHGRSEAVRRPCTRSDLAADLVGVLDALALDRAFVVGHSAGGVIAMQAAVEYPERLIGLVLVGTASECNDKTAAWYERCAASAREQGGAAALKAMGVRAQGALVPDGEGFAELALAMRTLNRDPLTRQLTGVTLPALVIVGEKDFLGVGGSVILSRALADSRLEIVPERGHGIYLEDPDWFAERLTAFFDEVLPAGATLDRG